MGSFDVSPNGWAFIDEAASRQVDSVLDEVEDDALEFVPRDTNELADSIEKQFQTGDLEGYVKVGTDHWAPQEYGSRPHTISIRNKKTLSNGNAIFGPEVEHPGNPPRPYMRPALLQKRQLRKDQI